MIAEDVTEKERLRVQLQQSQRLESLGQLAGGVAHDFNNLLAVILGYASFIERRAEEGSQRRARRRPRSARPASAPTRLTRQLLSFARREVVRPQRARPHRRRARDGAAAAPHARRARRPAHVAGRRTCGRSWPTTASSSRCCVNLAVNARDAMPDGGTLTLDTENIAVDEAYASTRTGLAPGRYVRLRVSDTGVGMDAATSPRARSSRSSPPSPRARAPGSGWRRSTASSPRPAGTCRSTPSPGLGTTFTRPAARRPTRPCRTTPPATPRDRARGGGETILVVEDEPAMLEVTRRILDRQRLRGADRRLRAGGARGSPRSTTGEIDVLLTDVVMPRDARQGGRRARQRRCAPASACCSCPATRRR